MSILDLTEVYRGEARFEGELRPDDPLWEGSGLQLMEPLRLDLVAQPVSEGVLVRGRMVTRLALECRRCLTEVVHAVDDEITLLFEPLLPDEEEDLDGEVYPLPSRGDQLDLKPALREELMLRVPEFVVCTAECRGLCATCGANLNETTCECVPEAAESPWDALRNLKFD